MKIGIFSGTFDPFHAGHYEIVNKVLDEKLVDKVVILPTIDKYYRSEKDCLFGNLDREKIIERWFVGRKDVILDFSEYTYHDLDISRRYYHMLSDVIERYGRDNEYVTIIGADSYENFKTWYRWEDVLKNTELLVFDRIGHTERHIDNIPAKWHFFEPKFAGVSATKIRERLVKDMSAMSLGPNTTCLDLYLDEIDDYLKTGKTYEDRHQEYLEMEKEAKKIVGNYFDKIDFDSIKREAIRKASSMKANEYLKELESNKSENCLIEKDELVAHTPIFDIIKGAEVEAGFRPVKIKSNDWVSIVVEKDGKFLMERQLRYGLNMTFEEFPCGIVENDEEPIIAALCELKEETGIAPTRYSISYLGKYAANPAFMTNYMHYFYIELKDYVQYDQQLDAHEHLDWYWLDKNKAFDNFLKSNGSAILGSCWMLLIREGIVTEWND